MAYVDTIDFPPTKAIEAFLALAKYRDIHKAAAKIGVTAIWLRASVRRVERRMNVSLFDRHKPIILSEAGEALVPIFKRYVKSIKDAKRCADWYRGVGNPYCKMVIGARPEVLDIYWTRIEKYYPNKRLVPYPIEHEFEAVPYLRERKIDVALGFNQIPVDWVECQEFAEVDTWLFCSDPEAFRWYQSIPLGWVEGYKYGQEKTEDLGKPLYPGWCFDNLHSLWTGIHSGVVVGRLPDWLGAPGWKKVSPEKQKIFAHRSSR